MKIILKTKMRTKKLIKMRKVKKKITKKRQTSKEKCRRYAKPKKKRTGTGEAWRIDDTSPLMFVFSLLSFS
jgi:hypothetical protein